LCDSSNHTPEALLVELDLIRREYNDFCYRVSHDFSAQLRMVEVFSSLLEQEQNSHLDEAGRQQLAFLRAASQRMNEMVQALLTLSRIGQAPGKMACVTVAQLAQGALALTKAHSPELVFVLESGGDLAVRTDPGQVVAILEELLTNSAKFSPPGVRVALDANASAGGLHLTLSDSGPGIPTEHWNSVFEIFRSLHPQGQYPGVGAGLTLARKRARVLGGSLTLVPARTEGCACRLTLPLA
jgi:signal transduction histidine kinase